MTDQVRWWRRLNALGQKLSQQRNLPARKFMKETHGVLIHDVRHAKYLKLVHDEIGIKYYEEVR